MIHSQHWEHCLAQSRSSKTNCWIKLIPNAWVHSPNFLEQDDKSTVWKGCLGVKFKRTTEWLLSPDLRPPRDLLSSDLRNYRPVLFCFAFVTLKSLSLPPFSEEDNVFNSFFLNQNFKYSSKNSTWVSFQEEFGLKVNGSLSDCFPMSPLYYLNGFCLFFLGGWEF